MKLGFKRQGPEKGLAEPCGMKEDYKGRSCIATCMAWELTHLGHQRISRNGRLHIEKLTSGGPWL